MIKNRTLTLINANVMRLPKDDKLISSHDDIYAPRFKSNSALLIRRKKIRLPKKRCGDTDLELATWRD